MSKDLVPIDGVLPDRQEVERELARLGEAGRIDELHEVADQARAYQEFARRQQARDKVNAFGRVQVLAEANIGLYDLKQYPDMYQSRGSLHFGDVEIRQKLRSVWRVLGAALMLERLNSVLADLERDPNSTLSSNAAYKELLSEGWPWADSSPFAHRYRELKQRGVTQTVLIKETGISKATMSRYLRGAAPRIPLITAYRLADAMGIDQAEIRLYRKRPRSKRRRPHRERKPVGGRLDETYSLVRKALQELDRATGQSNEWGTMEAWEHLYEAERIIGKALKRAV